MEDRRTDESTGNERRPIVAVVDSDPVLMARTIVELERRYSSDYRIVAIGRDHDAREAIRDLARSNELVALVLVAHRLDAMTGAELLAEVAEIFPVAKRGLLVDFGSWGDPDTASAIRTATALGHADYYVLRPSRRNDEYFHRTVCEFLHEWARLGHAGDQREFVVVHDARSRRGHELRDLLTRNGIPHAHLDADADEARRMLARSGVDEPRLPVVVTVDGRMLEDPTNEELARFYGVTTEVDTTETFDLAIVGAGPGGLAAAVTSAAEGLRTVVIENESIGGQAGSSSRIRNYLGFARGVAGAELAQRAYQQAWVFGVHFVHMTSVRALRSVDGVHCLALSNGAEVRARAVVLAMGVSYRRLDVEGLDDLVGVGVHYGASVSEAMAVADRDVVIVGGGNSAGQAALHLARYARSVTIAIRSDTIGRSMSNYLCTGVASASNVTVRTRTQIVGVTGKERLEGVTFRDSDTGVEEHVEASGLFLFIGASPRTEWLPDNVVRDERGFVLTGLDAAAALGERGESEQVPGTFETTLAGVFAVGDVRAGSVKRVASAVGEGSVAVAHVVRSLVTDG